MADTTKSGCFGCRYAEWDADGATCVLTGLLVGNYGHDCQKRVAEKQTDSTELHKVSSKPKNGSNRGQRPMTNGDRIRNFDDETLSEFLFEIGQCCSDSKCDECPIHGGCAENARIIEHWLRQRVAEPRPDSTWNVPGRPKSEQADLKPCPFCGKNKVKIDYPYFPDTYCWVRCYECYCTTSAFKTPEEAVEAWNRRAYEIAMRRAAEDDYAEF